MTKIEPGEIVIIVLREPREKIWGTLGEITPAGVFVRGIDLNSFEEFARSVKEGDEYYGLSEQFFPLWRVERISKDERNGSIPATHEQFMDKTGFSLNEI